MINHEKPGKPWERRRPAATRESMTFVAHIADVASLREGGGDAATPKGFAPPPPRGSMAFVAHIADAASLRGSGYGSVVRRSLRTSRQESSNCHRCNDYR